MLGELKVVAVLLAAGKSCRYAGNQLKQLSLLHGKPLFQYALETFHSCELVDELLLLVPAGKQAEFSQAALLQSGQFSKLLPLVVGGEKRFASSYRAVQALAAQPATTLVLIHDAARPLVSLSLIEESIRTLVLGAYDGVAPVLPLTDSLGKLGKSGLAGAAEAATSTLQQLMPRREYVRLQTPQVFSLALLRAAFAAAREPAEFTDDCSVILAYKPSARIKLCHGEETNLKVTQQHDLNYLEFLLSQQEAS